MLAIVSMNPLSHEQDVDRSGLTTARGGQTFKEGRQRFFLGAGGRGGWVKYAVPVRLMGFYVVWAHLTFCALCLCEPR